MSSSAQKDTAVTETNVPSEIQSLPEDTIKETSYFTSIRRYIWDDPAKSSKEKWFLFKLDIFLLSISCLGYFSKNLDQANVANAYVSGMSDALKMKGSELTYAGNVFTAGYVLGQLPAVILVTRIRPSILIPTMEVLWSIFTFCSASVKTTSQLYAIRFLIALCEGTYFPTVVYIIGSWYTKSERGKRMTIFYATASFAGMFSGYLQAGAYKGLNGVLGHAGWQWLFIVCGIISLPIAITGYFFYPDFPETTRAFYITKEEAEFARRRLIADGMKPLGASAWDRTKIFRIMKQWQFWVLPVGYFLVQGSYPIYQPVFALWLKSTHHSIYQVNVWPTGQYAVGVVVQLLAGVISDSPLLRGRRWQTLIAMQIPTIFACIVLAVWDVPIGLKYAAYYLTFTAAGVPGIYYACYIQSIWWTLTVWRTVLAPRFHAAFIGASCLGVTLCVLAVVLRLLEKHDIKKRALVDEGTGDEETARTGAR
ncbi:allantoate permease, putative [Talaromyces stipitatus ATCC 10500]|uniref:Allantoate permease, putative n=1 Tax=Talaromyces stipitatus (strain ATCC 10500 / CBS 375.48 / QM 6759 / NRRL 1006) TaxID=441959 RepID=B8MRF8_TALSN|nr:allantoate permease, putative [Talaromyces stipitatus ATCC 10500]EED13095.1 allantoate permease, putative [Talaromyces stipitatus ATCC 10500]